MKFYNTNEQSVKLELSLLGVSEDCIKALINQAKCCEGLVKFTDRCPEMGPYKFRFVENAWQDNIPHYDDYKDVQSTTRVFEDVKIGEPFSVLDTLDTSSGFDYRGLSFVKMFENESETILRSSKDATVTVDCRTPWIVNLI